MDAGLIVAIAVAAIVLIALFVVLGKKSRDRRHETQRVEAHEAHREADVRGARADKERASAEERAARAKKEQALAREQAARADKEQRAAEERREYASDVDPDR